MSDKKFDLLRALSELSYRLHTFNMRQAAADYDYIIDWMKSPLLNNGVHRRPHPAGKNTSDEYSNNCPIPFHDYNHYEQCINKTESISILENISTIINELSSLVSDEIEVTALDAYKEYTDDILHQLDENHQSSLPGEIITAYFSAKQTPIEINKSYYYPLYDQSGVRLKIDPDYEYIPKKYILSDDYEVLIPSVDATKAYFYLTSNQNRNMSIYHTYSTTISNVNRLVYEKRKAILKTAWLSQDKTPKSIGASSTMNIFDKNGNYINSSEGLDVVAYYYIDGEKIYNNDLRVRTTNSNGRLVVGAASTILVEKIEFCTSPVAAL